MIGKSKVQDMYNLLVLTAIFLLRQIDYSSHDTRLYIPLSRSVGPSMQNK